MTTDSLSALDGITWKRQLKATCAPKPSLAFWAPRNNEEVEEEAGRKATQLGRNAATTDYDGGLRWGREEGDVRCCCCMLVREKHGLAASVASEERYYTTSARSQRIAHCSSSNRVWPKEKAASVAVPFIVLLVVVALAEDFLYFRLPRNGPVLAITAGLHAEKKVVCVLYHSTRTTWRMLLKLFGSLQTFLAKKKKKRLSPTRFAYKYIPQVKLHTWEIGMKKSSWLFSL